MRQTTKSVVGLLSLGVLGTSWSIGQAATVGFGATAAPATTGSQSSESTNTATPAPTESATATSTPTPTASATPTATPTPTPTASKTAAASGASVTKTSAAIQYVAHRASGTMQISVTKSGGKITAIDIIQGGTEGAQWAQVPGILADAAVKSNGANFGNLGGATHTTDAFYQALESALAKF